jgi:hypothetical protein
MLVEQGLHPRSACWLATAAGYPAFVIGLVELDLPVDLGRGQA